MACTARLDLRGRPVNPLVSVVIPCRNEVSFIGRCLDSVLASEYPANLLEVIVADGMSLDGTRECVAAYTARDSRVRLIDNPAGVTPVALNRAIEASRGTVIVRLDARAEIAQEYVARAVESLDSSEADCVGGAMRTLTEGSGKFAEAIRIALTHPFGVGNSHFRTGSGSPSNGPRWVDAVYGACWRREVFDRLGWFNERLERSQDIEFSTRLRRAGGRILVSPEVQINYYVRGSLRDFWRRNWSNGVWAVLPLACSPGIVVRWRHLAPLGLVIALTGAVTASVWLDMGWPAAAVAGPYVAANVAAAVHAAFKERKASVAFLMPVVFSSLHLAYGFGSLWGCVRLAAALARPTATEPGVAS
jgi:succinoglycan biosynthesis protein ExoA